MSSFAFEAHATIYIINQANSIMRVKKPYPFIIKRKAKKSHYQDHFTLFHDSYPQN